VVVSFDTVNGFIIESSTLGVDGSIQINQIAGSNLVEDTLGINDFTVNNGTGFQVEAPDDTSNYSTSLPVYDSKGGQHNVSIYFRKAIETDSSAIWEWFAYVPEGDTPDGRPAEVQARGTVTFNNSGVLIAQKAGDDTEWLTGNGGFDFARVDEGQFVDIDFGFDSQTNVTTQFSAASSTLYQTQDGYGSGYLQDVAVDPEGKITGNYSNGQVLYLAQVALANFTNPWGLSREGGNNYAATNASGIPVTAEPGTSGTGRISPNSLEQSNVDLSTEFVAMIIQQRGFQANSKVITTTDSMLAELINLKR
jgi:flagellar hook protein FlgE